MVVEIGPRPLYITLTAVASAPAAAAIVPSTPKRNQHVNVSVPESESHLLTRRISTAKIMSMVATFDRDLLC